MQRWCMAASAALSGLALFAIMALTFADVLGRKLLARSIPGSLELTELLMVVVIFAALPMVSQRDEHVVFNSLDGHLSHALRTAQCWLVESLCATALAGLSLLMWRTGDAFVQTGETTAQLAIGKAPFIYGMAVACALSALVHLLRVRRPAPASAADRGTALS
ncbi:TRAP transporter small permease [Comamonadaceae bacterium G21597-S1]|nr:TRAP transporter small permease [Comamonadaceae bacterium G21597-S1]